MLRYSDIRYLIISLNSLNVNTVLHNLNLKILIVFGKSIITFSMNISNGSANPAFIILKRYVLFPFTVNVSKGMSGFLARPLAVYSCPLR